MNITLSELDRMRRMPLKEIDRNEVIKFGSLNINTSAPVEEKILEVLNKDINPYFRKTKNGCVVKISFSNNGTTFHENFMGIFSKRKRPFKAWQKLR